MNDPIGLRGKTTTGPRWDRFRELNNAAAGHLSAGRVTEAAAMFEEAHGLTLVGDLDAAGFDCRARVLGNLAAIAKDRGDTGAALRLAEEALQACASAEAEAGDRYGTAAVRASVLIHRAQTFQFLGRFGEALADLDAAQPPATDTDTDTDTDASADDRLLAFMLHNTRSVLLIGLERLEEAASAAHRALELATVHDPRLAAHPYANLAAIAQAHNEHDTALTYLRLAEQLHTAAGDHVQAALAIANQGRAAARLGDLATAARLLATAEEAFADGEQPLHAAEIRCSRAHVAFQSGDTAHARALLPAAVAALRDAGHTVMLAEALALEGDMHAADADYTAAEHAYLDARARYASTGAQYHLARLDMRRALAVPWQYTPDPAEQRRLLHLALHLALPSALATDALRHRYSPGPARERWAATVATPAMAHVLHLAVSLRDGALIAELLEHMSATVALEPAGTAPPVFEPIAPPDPAPETAELPFAASAFTTGTAAGFPAARFAPPPRLRVNPNRPSALEPWIAEAERRYGFPIRSDQVVDAW